MTINGEPEDRREAIIPADPSVMWIGFDVVMLPALPGDDLQSPDCGHRPPLPGD
jgi:hypothetical protein